MAMMNEEWVLLWYQSLSENYDYSLYADAREKGDVQTCKEYEGRFECVAGIYEDFGKLTSCMHEGLNTISAHWWRDWFEPRKHLFLPDVRAVVASDTTSNDRLLLNISLKGSLLDTVAEITRQVKQAHAECSAAGTVQPKYKLHLHGGDVAVKFGIVKSAVITSIGKYAYVPDVQTDASVKAAMIDFLQHHITDMGWRLGNQEMQDLLQSGTLSEERYESFKTLVNRSRRTFRALSRNAIRGSFPDLRPYKSLVWDRFKMEQTDK